MRQVFSRWLLCLAVGLAVVSRSSAAEEEPRPVSTLALTLQETDEDVENPVAQSLVREILRQAILIAARDELGLSTRDMALRETIASEANDVTQPLDVHTAQSLGKFVRIRLGKLGGAGPVLFYEKQIPAALQKGGVFSYLELAAAAEALSRTELVDALKRAGFSGQANPSNPMLGLAPGIRPRLQEMNFFSQFAAIREVHSLQRVDGESAETLGALVRGYANLGQLTNFHWNASHKVFKARALLYAQRLVNLDKNSPWSLRHRAYALALVGLHGAALKDLQTAAEASAAKGSSQTESPPAWEPIIAAYCRYDAQAVDAATNDENRQLAALVSFLGVSNTFIESQALTTGKHTLQVAPECYAVCDAMVRYGGVINQHFATVHGPKTLSETLRARLQDVPGTPIKVLRELKRATEEQPGDPALEAGPHRVALVKGLVAAADHDSQEPSWEVLGRLLEDVTFVHAFRRLAFFRGSLALPREAYEEQFQAALELVADHPCLPAVKCAVLDSRRDAELIQQLCKNMRMVDVELPFQPLESQARYVPRSAEAMGPKLWRTVLRHSDLIAHDLELVGHYTRNAGDPHVLLEISPHSPLAIAMLITNHPSFAQSRMKQWESEYGAHPVVSKALTSSYLKRDQLADAQRCAQQYVAKAPDHWGFATLANTFWKQKQPEKWKQTLEESLNHEDFSLAHARTRVSIAQYHMASGQWAEALPYADAAAQSGATWALVCASECHEALQHWEQSHELIRSNAQRYSGQEFTWYFWCRRTGHGDASAAEKLAAQRADKLLRGNTPNGQDHAGTFYVLAQMNELAQAAFKKAFDSSGNPYSAVHLALLAEQAGNADARDLALAGAIDRGPQYRTHTGGTDAMSVLMAKWLQTTYRQPADAAVDLDGLESLLTQGEAGEKVNNLYFAARYFQMRGNPDLARKYLNRCLAQPARARWSYTLASALIRDLPADAEAKPTAGQQ
jgi:hypothetical protein